MAKQLSAFYANMATKNRAATSQSTRVKNGDSLDLQAESENYVVGDKLISEGYPTSEMTVQQAKQFDSVPLTKAFNIWTYYDNVSALSRIMPVVKTTNLNMEFERVSHMVSMTRHAPERTRAHTLQQRRSRFSIHLNNYNIGIEVLTRSLETKEGYELYMNDLQAMRISYLESNATRTIIELQTCQTPWRDPTRRWGNYRSLTSDTLKQAIEIEKSFFGIVQQEAGSLELLDTLIHKAQEHVQGADGDTYIMPRSIIAFQTQVLDESKYYMFGGPEAVARFKRGPNEIMQDSRGNAIVTFRCYEMDGQPPLKPLLEFIDIVEYFTTRDARINERYDLTYESSQRNVMIFDVDRDQWFAITTRYVLENCHRFDPVTGAPYGLDHELVNRHDVDYTVNQFDDSYHYTVVQGPQVFRRQCVLMGQIHSRHITIPQIKQKGGEYTTMLMSELNKLGSAASAKKAIDDGLSLLRQIEDANGAQALAYVEAALPNAAVSQGINTRSVFGQSFLGAFYPQNSDSGVELPTSQAARTAAAALRVPAGYGSYAGFKAIARAFEAANKSEATFTANTGLPAEVAKKATAFLAVFDEYVNYASAFYSGSFGVDPAMSAPWWRSASPAHAIWDAVVTPQHRLPILVEVDVQGQATLVATPLVYSPRLVASLRGGSGALRFADPRNPRAALALDSPEVTALANFFANGDAAALGQLDPALQPLPVENSTPAAANSILANYQRSTFGANKGLTDARSASAAPTPMEGVLPGNFALGKRGASAMSAGLSTQGRTLKAFGGAVAAAPPSRVARVTRSMPLYAEADIADELTAENFVSNWDEIDSDSSLDHFSKWNCKLYLLSPFNLKVLLNWDARNMWVPVSSIGFRCGTLGTESIIKVKAGECGNQYYAYPSYRWNIDGILGVFRGQLDYYFAAKVTDDKKVFQVRLHFTRLIDIALTVLTGRQRLHRAVPRRLWLGARQGLGHDALVGRHEHQHGAPQRLHLARALQPHLLLGPDLVDRPHARRRDTHGDPNPRRRPARLHQRALPQPRLRPPAGRQGRARRLVRLLARPLARARLPRPAQGLGPGQARLHQDHRRHRPPARQVDRPRPQAHAQRRAHQAPELCPRLPRQVRQRGARFFWAEEEGEESRGRSPMHRVAAPSCAPRGEGADRNGGYTGVLRLCSKTKTVIITRSVGGGLVLEALHAVAGCHALCDRLDGLGGGVVSGLVRQHQRFEDPIKILKDCRVKRMPVGCTVLRELRITHLIELLDDPIVKLVVDLVWHKGAVPAREPLDGVR